MRVFLINLGIAVGPFVALWWALFASPLAKTAAERRRAAVTRRILATPSPFRTR